MNKKQKSALYMILVLVLAVSILMLPPVRSAIADKVYSGGDAPTEVKVTMAELSVDLYENGDEVNGELYTSLKAIDPGMIYEDKIEAVNNGSKYDEIVRVIVTKYWTESGGKRIDLSPEFIVLTGCSDSLWAVNPAEHTDERDVYYLKTPLAPGKAVLLFDHIMIDKEVRAACEIKTDEDNENRMYAVYEYDSLKFVVEIEVQSLQVEAASEAVSAVWGVTNVTVDNNGNVSVN
ncbi:MAG: hypothetical protein IKD81_05375 [Eubacteriaceae bacterium]|nr:hypothetical protein [Eubacteriaceae bacterium]